MLKPAMEDWSLRRSMHTVLTSLRAQATCVRDLTSL